MTQNQNSKQIKLSSIAKIQEWAERSSFERYEKYIIVFKNGVWNYFHPDGDGYVLKMTSMELLGENK